MRVRLGKARVALLALLLVFGWDVIRPPERQLTARLLIGGIDLYQATLSPVLGATCRFEPSCSRYAEASIRRYGAIRGSWRGLTRLARCGPWTPAGTIDPP